MTIVTLFFLCLMLKLYLFESRRWLVYFVEQGSIRPAVVIEYSAFALVDRSVVGNRRARCGARQCYTPNQRGDGLQCAPQTSSGK